MKSFPSAFAAEKNRKTGISPVWMLKLTVNAVDYYLSDHVFTVAGWNGGVTTKAWVESWGPVLEQVTGAVDEIRVSDIALRCVVDPDEATNIETLALASDIEKSPAVLYLWFSGLNAATAPPQEMFRGYVREADLPDETTANLVFEDATVRLHSLVGTVITTADYPNADQDDVGKILPLPYGVVKNVPAVATKAGLVTTLKADITSGATSCVVARPDGIVANTTKFRIGSEVVKVTAVSGSTLTISRAQDSTTAAAHSAGDVLVEEITDPFVFVVSGHALTSIDKVLVRAGDLDVDVTDQCTRYTGQVGSQYSTYGAKGVVTITKAQAAVIKLRVGQWAKSSLQISNPEHNHSYTESRDQAASNTPATAGGPTFSQASVAPTYPAVSGVIEQTNRYTYSWAGGDMGSAVYVNGVLQHSGSSSGSGTWAGTTTGSDIPLITHVRGSGTGATVTLSSASRSVVFTSTAGNTAQASTLSGNINSTADLLIGGAVHADVTAPNTDPDDVIADLLTSWSGISSLSVDGSFPAGYKFNGVINEQVELLPLLHRLAFQTRSYFRVSAGAAKLIVRPDTLTGEKTIAACRVDGGRKVYARRKAPLEDVVNIINLRYDRDWTKADGDDAYRQVSSATDATSITDYGERERPELFRCDFITAAAMADDVRDFYLADLKRRKWLHEFETHLDHAEIEFGAVVTLGFAGDTVVEVVQSGLTPGDKGRMDTIRMIGRG
ncbi:MAG: hypothetical protein FDZ69_07400 [Deltaproteobacteria bacterium]|nr:MAG: hypothetical protein FDZ69_07400 [Deltaproteobacteria bacterium]